MSRSLRVQNLASQRSHYCSLPVKAFHQTLKSLDRTNSNERQKRCGEYLKPETDKLRTQCLNNLETGVCMEESTYPRSHICDNYVERMDCLGVYAKFILAPLFYKVESSRDVTPGRKMMFDKR